MSLDIFFREDVLNALLAANEASSATAEIMAAIDGACHSLPRRVSVTCSECGGPVSDVDLFFAEEIRNALLEADQGRSATTALVADLRLEPDAVGILRAYRQGYKAALCTVALAFGLSPTLIPPLPPGLPAEVPAKRGGGQ